MAQKRPKRYPYWSFVMWEESAPDHWINILNSLQIAAAVSPLHDKDVWDYDDEEVRDGKHEAGEPKKAHWHVNLYYEGKKAFEQVLEDLEPLEVKFIKNIRSKRAADRYLCHLNDAGRKYVYDPEEIIALNGAEPDISDDKEEDPAQYRDALIDFITCENIREYSDLIERVKAEHYDLLDYAASHTIFLNTYISSRRHRERGDR